MTPVVRVLSLSTFALLATLGAYAEASPPAVVTLQLALFHPFRPGVLAQCENAQMHAAAAAQAFPDLDDPRKAWIVQETFKIRWAGGEFEQQDSTRGSDSSLTPRTDLCFALIRDGQVVVSGAVVSEQSARLLGFPTLVRMRAVPGTPTQYELRPRFPGTTADSTPSAWSVLNTP